MTEIVPRWEWRTFGDGLDGIAERFSDPERTEDSTETYLLSRAAEPSVKVRGGRMDVKLLVVVDDDGLEQWRPVEKAAFPLAVADVEQLLQALGVPAAPLGRDAYELEQLLHEIVEPNADLLAVEVRKQRSHVTIDGCMAELSTLTTATGALRTVVLESPDPALVVATRQKLALDGRRNVNVPRGLKTVSSFDTRRFGVIDVGTNSVKFHVGERAADGSWTSVVDRAEISRLGEGLDEGGTLQPEPMSRTADAIAGMADEARRDDAQDIAAVGTAALRIAPNSSTFVALVRERAGIEVEVIPGEEEARLAYQAARSGLAFGEGSIVVFDTGGGSSQFTFGRGARVDETFSVDVGAVRFTERFGLGGPVSPEQLDEALAAIRADLGRLAGRGRPDALVGMGGANTNLAAVKHGLATYDPDVVQGTVLDRAEIERQIELYRTRTDEQRREIVGLQPKRADVILAGACVVRSVLDAVGCDSLTVSDRGLRHGLLVERFGLR
jgi:exopolyphosphatase/guanosine-5'-triphosphate,3'-diphosphate pyrophosphatase